MFCANVNYKFNWYVKKPKKQLFSKTTDIEEKVRNVSDLHDLCLGSFLVMKKKMNTESLVVLQVKLIEKSAGKKTVLLLQSLDHNTVARGQ